MSEWFKEHAWKACKGATLSEVRILSLPPFCCAKHQMARTSGCRANPLASVLLLQDARNVVKITTFLILESKFFLDFFHLGLGKLEMTAISPVFIKRHQMNVGMRNIGADDFPDNAAT